jgi:hypothetical protein
MYRSVVTFGREERDELVRKLRGQGLSIRRIAKHPGVRLSPAMVHAILKAEADEPASAEGQDFEAMMRAAGLPGELVEQIMGTMPGGSRCTAEDLVAGRCVPEELGKLEAFRLRYLPGTTDDPHRWVCTSHRLMERFRTSA